ncbi:MAG: alanine:cation symporter family protein, partial [Woeseiaceae bacterium]
IFALIIANAFTPTEASGAFIGGTVASAFLFGMKRAVFSNEAGQGSSPIAHSAAKTDEPVREGVVAGLEPFIDTIVVCTFTALIILATGIWNRGPDVSFTTVPDVAQTRSGWQFEDTQAPAGEWQDGEIVTLIVKSGENPATGQLYHRVDGVVTAYADRFVISWNALQTPVKPEIVAGGLYKSYVGATLTAKALDSVAPGLGKWLITIASWLFGFSTIIAWAYYGEQGSIYLAGDRGVLPFKLIYCGLIILATLGHIKTDTDLDNMTGIGLGVMIWANLPICWIFGYQAMRAYKEYIGRLKDGRMGPDHPPPSIEDLLSGRDVESR